MLLGVEAGASDFWGGEKESGAPHTKDTFRQLRENIVQD